jgi:hypothetical protein
MNLPLRLLLPLFAAISVLFAGVADAAGPPATETVVTQQFSKTIVLADTPPCTGTVTYDVRDTFHITDFGDGKVHVVNNQAGNVVFVSSADGKVYNGHFAGTFNVQAPSTKAAYSETGTYSLRVQAADGSVLRFSVTFHGTFTPYAGEPVVEVANIRCSSH